MWKLLYTPEGAEKPREYPFDLGRMELPDVEFVEDELGMSHHEFSRKVGAWHKANRALLFVLMRAENPGLQWEELQPRPAELAFDLDDDQLAQIVATIKRRDAEGEPLTSEERAMVSKWESDHPDGEGSEDPKA